MTANSRIPSDSRATIVGERWVLLACIIASSMAFIDATALNVALPALQKEFSATGVELLWIINGYGLPLAALLLVGGAAADRFGRKLTLMTGIVLFAAASGAGGLAPDARALVVARVFQGIGAATMIPGSMALLAASMAPHRRGQSIGTWTACSVVMTAFGPVLGGVLAGAGLWRCVFFINIPLALVALSVLHLRVPEPARPVRSGPIDRSARGPRADHPIDLASAISLLISLAALNYGLLEAAYHGFPKPVVICALAVALVSLLAFAMIETRSANPFIPLALFRNADFRAVCLLTLAFYSGVYGMTFFLSLNLIQVQGFNAPAAGLAQLPLMVLVVLVSPLVGRLVDRYGIRAPLLIGPAVAGVGFLLLAVPGLTTGPHEYWWQFFPPLAVLGLAMGITVSPLSTAVINSIPAGCEGLASGINSTLSRLSSVLGIALLGPIALAIFQGELARQLEPLGLNDLSRSELAGDAVKLGATKPPSGLSAEVRASVEQAIRLAFVSAFRTVSLVSAGAVWLSAIVAATMLGTPTRRRSGVRWFKVHFSP
jgi:EmrB/QacA subfamily drug resistance transporter